MQLVQAALILTVVGYTIATGYGSGSGSGGYGAGGSGSGGSRASSFSGGSSAQNGPPQPYRFDYSAADEQGNTHYRNEEGDQNGVVKGTYGYNDAQGLYRIVEYVADENGFRANIKTNEPGVDGKESPADVVLTAEQPPAGLAGAASSPGGGYKPSGAAPSGFSGFSGAGKPRSGGSGKSGY